MRMGGDREKGGGVRVRVRPEPEARPAGGVPRRRGLPWRLIRQHAHAGSAWVVVDGGVYDVTGMLGMHPGGREVLAPYLGKDATAAMTQPPPHGHAHSKGAFRWLQRFKVGVVETEADGDADGEANGEAEAEDEADGEVLSPAVTCNGESRREGERGRRRRRLVKGEVDFSRGILDQCGRMGDRYVDWILSFPVKGSTVKMFDAQVAERLTRSPWWAVLALWVPVLAALAAYLFVYERPGVAQTLLPWACAGYVTWLLAEYCVHRFLFHMKTTSYVGNVVHHLVHGHHHITPLDTDRLTFPPLPAAAVAYAVFRPAVALFGRSAGLCFWGGFVAGYVAYDMTHFLMHYAGEQGEAKHALGKAVHQTLVALQSTRFMRRMKRRHNVHHYQNPDVYFAISNPLFDHVFRTGEQGGKEEAL